MPTQIDVARITPLPHFGQKTGFQVRLYPTQEGIARASTEGNGSWAISDSPRGSLATYDFKLYVDVAARGVRIGANLFVRFLGEGRQFSLRQAFVLDV